MMDRELRDLYYGALNNPDTPPDLRRRIRFNMLIGFVARTAIIVSTGVALLALFCKAMCWYCGGR